jgi:ATP-dependent helicase/DNAse subunit B
MGSSEMSRYIVQLLYNEKYKIIRRTQTFNIVPAKIPEININKSPEMMKVLEKYYDGSGSEYFLSPSALSSYIDCSLRFYFRYVAGLKEFEKPIEEIDPSTLGSILHDAMHRLYEPFHNLTVQKEALGDLIKDNNKIENILKDSIAKIYFKNEKIQDKDKIRGRNIIIVRILEKFIRQIIETDLKIAPFCILELERKIVSTFDINTKSGIIKVRVGGNIDRVVEVDNYIRIIDYKTGSVETKFKNFDELFKPAEGKKAKKEILQAFIYSLLYKRNGIITKPVKPGLYTLRTIFGDQFDPGIYFDREAITDISKIENTFIENLQIILEEIFNPEISFFQTNDLKKCNFCAYKIICHRENEK